MDAVDHMQPTCFVQTLCGEGTAYMVVTNESTTQSTCTSCGPLTYQDSDKHRDGQCKPRASCDVGERFNDATLLAGTSTLTEGDCTACAAGQYQDEKKEPTGSLTCKQHTTYAIVCVL